MNEHFDRRDFVKMGAAAGMSLAIGGQTLAADDAGAKKRTMDKVRIGFVGIGSRGTFLLGTLLGLEGIEIKAICDIIPERVAKGQSMVAAAGQPKPSGYSRGETDFKRLCETEELDLVINAVRPWKWHVPIGIIGL